VVARDREHRRTERSEERGGPLVLLAAAAMSEIAARDDQCGFDAFDQGGERAFHRRVLARARVEVRDVKDACRHGRIRL